MQFTNNHFFTIIQDITVKYQEALMYLSRDLVNMSKHSLFTNNTMNEIILNLCYKSISHPEHWRWRGGADDADGARRGRI